MFFFRQDKRSINKEIVNIAKHKLHENIIRYFDVQSDSFDVKVK